MGFKPLPFTVDQADQGNWHIEDLAGQTRVAVETLVRLCIQYLERLPGLELQCFAV